MRKRHFSAAEKAENPCIYFGHTLNCLISLQLRAGLVKNNGCSGEIPHQPLIFLIFAVHLNWSRMTQEAFGFTRVLIRQ